MWVSGVFLFVFVNTFVHLSESNNVLDCADLQR